MMMKKKHEWEGEGDKMARSSPSGIYENVQIVRGPLRIRGRMGDEGNEDQNVDETARAGRLMLLRKM